jgi:dUTP pyrophosphatase
MSPDPVIAFKRLNPDRDQDLPLPRYMTPHAAGMDVCASIEGPLEMAPGQIALISTGLAMALPHGYEAQIRPRSGLAITHGITVVNAPGTIDSDYRGEVKIGLINLSGHTYTIRRGERIAQMVIQRVCRAQVAQVSELDVTERNEGGFGSTGSDARHG